VIVDMPATAVEMMRERPLPLPVAVVAAVGGGVALLLAFPPYGVWPLAAVGVALLAGAAHRRRPRAGAGLGFLTGVALFAPLLGWTNLHTGYLPWALLSLLQAGYLALLGAAQPGHVLALHEQPARIGRFEPGNQPHQRAFACAAASDDAGAAAARNGEGQIAQRRRRLAGVGFADAFEVQGWGGGR